MARDVLSLGQVRIHSGSATREEAMKEAADILEAAGAVTSAYFDAMQQREETVSTYMGNELAIPHGTNETKHTILDSALSVVRYDGGVDWGGEPVTFVVGIAGKGDEHLEILSQIAILFSDEDEVENLKRAQHARGAVRAWCPRQASDEGRPLRRGQHRPRLRRTAAARGRLRAGVLGCRGPARRRDQRASRSTPCTRSAKAAATRVVTGFRAINSATHPDEVIDEIAGANVVTTAVGPTILKFVAPHIVAGLALRDPSSPPLQIMACENAINATDLLRDEIAALAGDAWDALAGRAVFANTAVDRIVPAQPDGARRRRHGRAVLRMGDRATAVRRRPARASRARTSSTTSRRTSSASSSR